MSDNLERIWKEDIVSCWGYCPFLCLVGLRNIVRYLEYEGVSPNQYRYRYTNLDDRTEYLHFP
jgi:hypothetical protein